MSDNNDYTTGNLLDCCYFKDNYKLIIKLTKLKVLNKLILLENFKIKIMEQQCSLSLKNQKKLFLILHKTLSQSYK